jgi:hypothetical protein
MQWCTVKPFQCTVKPFHSRSIRFTATQLNARHRCLSSALVQSTNSDTAFGKSCTFIQLKGTERDACLVFSKGWGPHLKKVQIITLWRCQSTDPGALSERIDKMCAPEETASDTALTWAHAQVQNGTRQAVPLHLYEIYIK